MFYPLHHAICFEPSLHLIASTITNFTQFDNFTAITGYPYHFLSNQSSKYVPKAKAVYFQAELFHFSRCEGPEEDKGQYAQNSSGRQPERPLVQTGDCGGRLKQLVTCKSIDFDSLNDAYPSIYIPPQ